MLDLFVTESQLPYDEVVFQTGIIHKGAAFPAKDAQWLLTESPPLYFP
jgi:hypothetical protein